MWVRVIVWTLGVILGVLAVLSTNEYIQLASGYTVMDFLPKERHGDIQREYIADVGMLALGSTIGCLASFMFAFYRHSTDE